jgi:hypothetical protein
MNAAYLTTINAQSAYAYDLISAVDPGSCHCGSHACYECRRLEIDTKALAIVERERRMCDGMQGFDVEAHAWRMAQQYRCDAINALAFEDVAGELV